MNKEKQLEQIIKALYSGLDSAALISVNKDGSLNVEREEQSDYSFVVFDETRSFKSLLDKLEELGYSIDLDTFHGLIPGRELIKVDVTNRTVTRPMVVSINHHQYLMKKGSILIDDVLNAFDEIVINKNKSLANLLCQYNKNNN